MSHGFGGRTIFEDASFRLLKGEHIALIGANGEGKSTFLSIITGQMEICDLKVGEALGTHPSTCRKKRRVSGLRLRMYG